MLLHNDLVHLWVVDMDKLLPYYAELKILLSERELARESRFVFDHLKKHYTISQALLRQLLAHYSALPIEKIEYVHGPKGKPYLKDNPQNLQFNLSHSKNMALYGITKRHEVGVDIEFIRNDCLKDGLEEAMLSEREKTAFYSLSDEQRTQAFFNTWTQKEAILKAMGVGITVPMQNVEIAIAVPLEQPKIIHLANEPLAPHLWSIHSFSPALGFAGALAVKSMPIDIALYHVI